jgi:hypothetical protein
MMVLSPQVSIQTYPSSDSEPVAETFVYAYARLKWRLAVEGNHISVYWLDTDTKQIISDEIAQILYQEQEKTAELQTELDRYRQQFGELPPEP